MYQRTRMHIRHANLTQMRFANTVERKFRTESGDVTAVRVIQDFKFISLNRR